MKAELSLNWGRGEAEDLIYKAMLRTPSPSLEFVLVLAIKSLQEDVKYLQDDVRYLRICLEELRKQVEIK
jgi:hypothetical protein